MNQATNVNIVPSYGQRGDLHFSQYDVGRTATINLYAVNEAYTIPLSATVKIQATKPSGLGFDVACTYSGSVVTVVSTSTMTEEAGRFPAELHIVDNDDIIGTANFMFVVEPSPHPDGTIDGDADYIINEIKALVLESEGYALGTQDGVPVDSSSVYYHNNAKWLSDNAVLSDEVKQTLLLCFEKVAWIDGNGQTYYNALQSALNRGAEILSISAVYTQSGTVYDGESLDLLKTDLVVTAHYDDQTSETVIAYTLSGTLEIGTSTITVTYSGLTTTFNVNVSSSIAYYDYLESDGTAFIDTGLLGQTYASDSYIKYAKFTIMENVVDKTLFSIRNKYSTTGVMACTGSAGYAVLFGNAWTTITGKGYGDTLELELNYPDIKVGGTTYATVSGSTPAITSNTLTIPLFAGATGNSTHPSDTYVYMNGGYYHQISIYKLYRFTLTEQSTSTVIADMKPATYRGTPGMYDTVRNTFYGNANSTGAFTIGND